MSYRRSIASCRGSCHGPDKGSIYRRHSPVRPFRHEHDRAGFSARHRQCHLAVTGPGQPATAPSAGRCHGLSRERDGAAPAVRHPRGPALPGRRHAVDLAGPAGPGVGPRIDPAGPHPPRCSTVLGPSLPVRGTAMMDIGTRTALAWFARPYAESGQVKRLTGIIPALRCGRGRWQPVIKALDDGSWRSVFAPPVVIAGRATASCRCGSSPIAPVMAVRVSCSPPAPRAA